MADAQPISEQRLRAQGDAEREMRQALAWQKRSAQKLPEYELEELIGRGSYGRVYRARNVSTGSLVAIKMIDLDASEVAQSRKRDDPSLVDEALREFNVLDELRQSGAKNINYVIASCVVDKHLWIITPFMAGGSIQTLMRAQPRGMLSERYIMVIVSEVLEALKWVHWKGIIHRDIKTGNILLSEHGQVQLCDFGVSSPPELAANADKRNTVIGTVHHMAPEILYGMINQDKVEYGRNVDIWSLGTTIIQMATGLPPNARIGNLKELHDLITSGKPPTLDVPEFSQNAKDFVSRCCCADLKNRPSVADLLEHPWMKYDINEHPVTLLTQLIDDYRVWEEKGNKRATLFDMNGAQAPPIRDSIAIEAANRDNGWDFSEDDISVPQNGAPGFFARLRPDDTDKTEIKRGTRLLLPADVGYLADLGGPGDEIEDDNLPSQTTSSRDETYQPDHPLALMHMDPEQVSEEVYRAELERLTAEAAQRQAPVVYPSRERHQSTFNMDDFMATSEDDLDQNRVDMADLMEGYEEPSDRFSLLSASRRMGSSDVWQSNGGEPSRLSRRMPADLSVAIPPNNTNLRLVQQGEEPTPVSSVYEQGPRPSSLPSSPRLTTANAHRQSSSMPEGFAGFRQSAAFQGGPGGSGPASPEEGRGFAGEFGEPGEAEEEEEVATSFDGAGASAAAVGYADASDADDFLGRGEAASANLPAVGSGARASHGTSRRTLGRAQQDRQRPNASGYLPISDRSANALSEILGRYQARISAARGAEAGNVGSVADGYGAGGSSRAGLGESGLAVGGRSRGGGALGEAFGGPARAGGSGVAGGFAGAGGRALSVNANPDELEADLRDNLLSIAGALRDLRTRFRPAE